jgi:hypothetical protein
MHCPQRSFHAESILDLSAWHPASRLLSESPVSLSSRPCLAIRSITTRVAWLGVLSGQPGALLITRPSSPSPPPGSSDVHKAGVRRHAEQPPHHDPAVHVDVTVEPAGHKQPIIRKEAPIVEVVTTAVAVFGARPAVATFYTDANCKGIALRASLCPRPRHRPTQPNPVRLSAQHASLPAPQITPS